MTCKIILLDDNREEFLLISHVAQKYHIQAEIIYFDSYLEFERNIENISEISCILLDYDMPKVNGIDALKLFQNKVELKYVPKILFSNVADPSVAQVSEKYGATSYMLKPKSIEGLKNLLFAITTIWGVSTNL